MGQKQKTDRNTPGTAGGPGGCDRTLAIEVEKSLENLFFFSQKNYLLFFCIYLLVMRRKDQTMVITMASYALQSRLGQKKQIFERFSSFYGQRSFTAAWATPSP